MEAVAAGGWTASEMGVWAGCVVAPAGARGRAAEVAAGAGAWAGGAAVVGGERAGAAKQGLLGRVDLADEVGSLEVVEARLECVGNGGRLVALAAEVGD